MLNCVINDFQIRRVAEIDVIYLESSFVPQLVHSCACHNLCRPPVL